MGELLLRAWAWLTQRPLQLVFLRLYDQVMRRLTGTPLPQYSQVAPLLYIGGQQDQRALDTFQKWGVHAVVNLRRNHDDAAIDAAPQAYLHLPVVDNTAPTQQQLAEGVAFIADQVAAGHGVYVHCGVGVGRAPTLAAAYLVSTGLDTAQAWAILQKKRPFIWPNRAQREGVRQFAAYLAQQAASV